MFKPIRKAIFPVGGQGTRFLPATKAVPKEMLPVVDKPLLQYAVDEALSAGIEQMIFVTARGKAALEEYFDVAGELVASLKAKGKATELALLDATQLAPGRIAYVRQQEPAGLGHAVWCARLITGDEPFAVLLPDELLWNPAAPALKDMVGVYERLGGNVISVLEVPAEHTHRYGIVRPGAVDGLVTEVLGVVEKPAAGHRAVAPRRDRPLHPPARGDDRPRRRQARRRERDPADRRDGADDRPPAVPRADLHRRPPRLRRQGRVHHGQHRARPRARRHRPGGAGVSGGGDAVAPARGEDE